MKAARSWRRYLRLGGSVREEVADEVAFHLEEQTRALVESGMADDAASSAALGMFGDRDRIERTLLDIGQARMREERRSAVLKDLRLDVRFAIRYLARRRGFALVAIGVLALGIGATSAVFAIVDAALLRPLPFPAGERVVRLSDIQAPDVSGVNVSWPEVQDWARGLTFLEAFGAIGTNVFILPEGEEPERVIGALVAGDYTGVLGLAPVLGRSFTESERDAAEHVVMLSESLWRDRFGSSRTVVGQPLRMNDEVYTIVGVMPREANVLAARSDIAVWLPLAPPEWATRGLHFMSVFGRIPEAMALDEAESRIEAFAQTLRDEDVTDHGILVERVRDRLVADSRPLLIVLAGAVVCLLLIVCANLANLFLSHATARRSEFAVRTALGAGRMRLTRQLLTEALVITLLGGLAGGVFGHIATGVVSAIAQQAALLAPADGIDLRVALFTGVVTLFVATVVGLWPAIRAGNDVAETLKDSIGRATPGRGGTRSRRALVGVEIALSVMLLAGSALMVRSLIGLLNEDPGFRAGQVLKFDMSLPGSRYEEEQQAQFFTTFLERIRAIPGVLGAGGINELPLSGGDVTGGFGITGREFAPDATPTAKKRVVTTGYFETLAIPVLWGRVFDDTDRAGAREVVVISETLARRYWPDSNPVGQRMSFSWGPGDEQEIIGVVGDVHHDGLDAAVEGMMYRPLSQFPFPGLTVVVHSDREPGALIDAVRARLRALDPALPIDDAMTLRELVRASVSSRSTLMVLLTGFAAIALLLAAVGVYAITAQSVGQRTQEIGVRKALGARDGDVLRLVVGEEAIVLGIGLVLGIAGALAATPLLRASLYGIEARDPVTLGAAVALLAAVGLFAAWLPARYAARLDPVRALRAG